MCRCQSQHARHGRASTHRSLGESVDRVGDDDELVREDGVGSRIELGPGGILQEIGVRLDQSLHSGLIQALWSGPSPIAVAVTSSSAVPVAVVGPIARARAIAVTPTSLGEGGGDENKEDREGVEDEEHLAVVG